MNILKWRRWRDELPPMDEANFYTKYLNDDKKYTEDQLAIDIMGKIPREIKDLRSSVMGETVVKFARIAAKNPALCNFVYDDDAEAYKIANPGYTGEIPNRMASAFFISWIANCVPRSIALEVCYGYGVDICGQYRQIGPEDPYFYFTHKDDLFAAIVERGLFTVDILNELQPKKMVFLGAGMAPEFRHLGLTLTADQRAILVDRDTTINPEELLSPLPFASQMEYLLMDIRESLTDPRLYQAEALVANGLISYVWDSFPAILHGAKQILWPGGHFIFELYPKHWEWDRNRDISGFFLPLKLFSNFDEIENSVAEVARAVGIDTEQIDTEYFYDDFENELMVCFDIQMPG